MGAIYRLGCAATVLIPVGTSLDKSPAEALDKDR